MDYRIEAFDLLLNEDCLLERYHPLIPYKQRLTENLRERRCLSKSACAALSDEEMLAAGLPTPELVSLFRRFLALYDAKSAKFKEIEALAVDGARAAAFRELYLLPGVKAKRAGLYYDSGYTGLWKIAAALPEDIIRDTRSLIVTRGLNEAVPLPKEVRTHIAVARALTEFAAGAL